MARLGSAAVALALLGGAVIAAPAGAEAVNEATDPTLLRDVGPLLGLRRHESSYSLAVGDYDDDGWTDFLIVHHGSRPSELFHNDHDGQRSTGVSIVLQLVDTIHDRPDRHGCVMGDPNLDDLIDLLCTKGAQQGTAKKWNELWIQGPEGTWVDRARTWGVEDPWGRGRLPVWIDLNRDRWPDLFLGNDIPRHDQHVTPDRTYVNDRGRRFDEVDVGLTKQIGADCAQTADLNRDGWDDLLLCGEDELFFFARDGDRFRAANEEYGVPTAETNAARLVDLNGDGREDLVTVGLRSLDVRLAAADGSFRSPVLTRPLVHGHGVAVGDVDGRRGPDILVVEGCDDRVNVPDVLLLNGGDATSWMPVDDMPRMPPGELAGCGDTAGTLDFDRDGMDDFVVLNGGGESQPLDIDGPDQLLTMGNWRPPR